MFPQEELPKYKGIGDGILKNENEGRLSKLSLIAQRAENKCHSKTSKFLHDNFVVLRSLNSTGFFRFLLLCLFHLLFNDLHHFLVSFLRLLPGPWIRRDGSPVLSKGLAGPLHGKRTHDRSRESVFELGDEFLFLKVYSHKLLVHVAVRGIDALGHLQMVPVEGDVSSMYIFLKGKDSQRHVHVGRVRSHPFRHHTGIKLADFQMALGASRASNQAALQQ